MCERKQEKLELALHEEELNSMCSSDEVSPGATRNFTETDKLIEATTVGNAIERLHTLAGLSTKQVTLPNAHPYSVAFRRTSVIVMWATLIFATAFSYGLHVGIGYVLDARLDPARPVRFGRLLANLFGASYYEDAQECFLACFLYLSILGALLVILLQLFRQRSMVKFTSIVFGICILLWIVVALLFAHSPYSVFGRRNCSAERHAQRGLDSVREIWHSATQLCVGIIGAEDAKAASSSVLEAFHEHSDAVELHVLDAIDPLPNDVSLETVRRLTPCKNSSAPYVLTLFGDVKPPSDLNSWLRAQKKEINFSAVTWTQPRFDFWRNLDRVGVGWHALASISACIFVHHIFMRTKLTRYSFYYACLVTLAVAGVFILLLSSLTPKECISSNHGCDAEFSTPLATLFDMAKATRCDEVDCHHDDSADAIVVSNAFSWTRGLCMETTFSDVIESLRVKIR